MGVRQFDCRRLNRRRMNYRRIRRQTRGAGTNGNRGKQREQALCCACHGQTTEDVPTNTTTATSWQLWHESRGPSARRTLRKRIARVSHGHRTLLFRMLLACRARSTPSLRHMSKTALSGQEQCEHVRTKTAVKKTYHAALGWTRPIES